MIKKFLLLVFFFQNFIKVESSLDYKYIIFFQLLNENYILCTEKGIHLYDSQIENLISQKLFSEEISESDFKFVNIDQFSIDEDGYVIIVYKNIFYFYSYSGSLLFSCDLTITITGKTYTLVPYKSGDSYNFMLGYIGESSSTMINYYNINIPNESIELLTTKNIVLRSASKVEQTTSNTDFSCQIMISNTFGDVLTCFYIVTYYLGINSYIINEDFAESSIGSVADRSIGECYIKSETTLEKDKAIVSCAVENVVPTICYDINSNQITSKKSYGTNIKLNSFSSVSLSFIKKTNEFILSAYSYSNNFTVFKFNQNLDELVKDNINDDCKPDFHNSQCGTLGYVSIVYKSESNSYNLMASCGSDGIKSYALPTECNPSEVNPTPSINENGETSTSSSDNNNPSTSEIVINPTTIPENENIPITTVIVEKNPSTILEMEDNPTTPEIKDNPTIIYEIQDNPSTIIELKDNPSTIYGIKDNPTSLSEIIYIPSTLSEIQETVSIITQINRFASTITYTTLNNNNYFYDEKTNKTIFLEPDEPCPSQFLYESKNSKECVKSCEITDILNSDCSINQITLNNIEDITKDMRNIINNTNITKDTNIVIEGDNVVFQIISSENMEQNINKNVSIIYLGDCADKLKEYYKIDDLLIFKMDLELNNTPPMVLNYEVYNPNNFTKLNLSLCEGMKIKVYSPYTPSEESLSKLLKLNESGYDLYNPNDSFYQDICSPFTTDNGTDILLSDRKADYFEDISLCEDGCTYEGYDYTIHKAKCECNVKEEIEVKENQNTKKEFFSSFSFDSFSNFKVLKCFKLVFSIIGQKNNKGSYIFIVVIFFCIILNIIFHINQMRNIAKIFRKVIESNFSSNTKKHSSFPPKKDYHKKNKNKKKDKKKKNLIKDNQKAKLIDEKIFAPNQKEFNKKHKNRLSINLIKYDGILKSKINTLNTRTNNSRKNKDCGSSGTFRMIQKDSRKINKNKKILFNVEEKIKNYNDEELNSLSYKQALLYDKRTFIQYYWDLLKRKHLILFTFISNNDYNIFHIKLSLFLFSFSLYFTVNAFFFEDKTMHKIYESKGNLDFLLKIPNILYSTIISSFINIIIKLLALSNKDMLKIKQITNKEESLKESAKLSKILKIKFNLFFIISFVFLLFFWYFIAAFCAVYKNTQGILIENTMTSFGLSLLYPFGLNLLPAIFRIPALRATKQNLECVYKFSKLLALI